MAMEEPSRNVPFILDVPFYRGLKPIDLRVGMKSHEAEWRLPDAICPAPDFLFLLCFIRPNKEKSQDVPGLPLSLPSSAANLSKGTSVGWGLWETAQ